MHIPTLFKGSFSPQGTEKDISPDNSCLLFAANKTILLACKSCFENNLLRIQRCSALLYLQILYTKYGPATEHFFPRDFYARLWFHSLAKVQDCEGSSEYQSMDHWWRQFHSRALCKKSTSNVRSVSISKHNIGVQNCIECQEFLTPNLTIHINIKNMVEREPVTADQSRLLQKQKMHGRFGQRISEEVTHEDIWKLERQAETRSSTYHAQRYKYARR